MTLFMGMLSVIAQNTNSVSGRVIDKQSKEAMEKSTLQLYQVTTARNGVKDTTFISGTFSNDLGYFTFNSVKKGNYLLKVSYLGYQELYQSLTKASGVPLSLGDIALEPDAIQIDEAVVTANVPKMVIKDDTVVYNADAFRVPEGSVIEALVEALPGAKIDDNGGITINGKTVKKFKMDGRDYMTGNNDAVMKNLPSYVIDKVKAYDEKSDLSRLTGVDDGNDDFVLEFVTKRSARNGLQMNPDIGYGTDNRYGIRLTAMKPFGAMRYTFMGNANNVNDRNFSGRGGRGRGNGNGQRHTKTAALDISYENNKDLRLSGRVTWNHSSADNWSRTGSENFVNTRGGAFSNSVSQSYSENNSWTGNMNLQWTIDSMTTLSFRPNMSFSTNDSRSYSGSASFNANPFDYVFDPLSDEGLDY
ncbi:MAG: carboxypeptidase-like regulatory domain-containing protein, partial [Prevotella sp.]|nr:carboxypeptidase-like regulatory domain-containing protein [Prevotella sp.]